MKKSLLIAGLLTASSLFAETKPFIGIDFTNTDVDYTDTYSITGGSYTYGGTTYNNSGSVSYNGSDSDSQPTFKAGVILDDSHRVYLRYGAFDGENDAEVKITTAHYDYMFDVKNDYDITPYIGAFAGMGKFETYIGDDTGLVYGANIGMVIPITDNLEFDVSYAYAANDIEVKESVSGLTGTYSGFTFNNFSASAATELKDFSIFNIGFNYKF